MKEDYDFYDGPNDKKDTREVKEDLVNHPSHYEKECSLECIEAMEVAFGTPAVYDFCLCNTFKYLWRYKFKDGEMDLRKAAWYLNKAESLKTVLIREGYVSQETVQKMSEQCITLHKLLHSHRSIDVNK